jgi:hypothetical protein
MYKLKDLKNVELKARFYGSQLHLAPDPANISYEIEHVLATRKRKNKTEHLGNKEGLWL